MLKQLKDFFQKLFKKFEYNFEGIFVDLTQKDIDDDLCHEGYIPLTEAEKKFLEELSELFDGQADLLEFSGCPEDVVQKVREQKAEVLRIAINIEITEGNIPFVMAVPLGYLEGVYGEVVAVPVLGEYDIPFAVLIPFRYIKGRIGQLTVKGLKVERRSKTGTNKIEVIELPPPPHFIYNVELIT